ncbi:unnamed protein product [Paramecium sonneborni]|uniref:Insulin-like growth factor binding protein, N-terminal n=1 Tax=Paramecium sonneborni TaxID=65129 RepID=A0A8S1N5V0_9CILI|nr:unnamed protein product [Paramecium sonneborni]
MFYLLINLIQLANSEWQLIYSDFYEEKIVTNLNWKSLESCSILSSQSTSTRQCMKNSLEFIRLNEIIRGVEKEFYYPHYQIRIITDVIYIYAKSGVNTVFQIQLIDFSGLLVIFQRLYQENILQKYDKVCQFDCGPGCNSIDKTRMEIKTQIIDAINHQIPSFKITYCFQPQDNLMRLGLRNILIYANSCHISCASCNGSTKSDCLTCYQGSPQGGICVCDESNKFTHKLIGCVQECPRDYYLADNLNYCQFNPRIKSMYNYFTQSTFSNGNQIPYEPWIYYPDPFHISNSNNIFVCSGQDQVGKFSYSQSMQLRLPENQGLAFLRIRVSFYFFGWQSDSVLKITVDQYSQMRIEKTLSNYTIFNGRLNKFDSLSCSSNNYDFLRIEAVLKTYTATPIIQFQAIQKLDSEFWSFNNVTIDYGLCQSNCTKCETYSKCLICESNFKLYRGMCVESCPMHSQLNNDNCLDYEDLINNSRYLIKAFYDMNTTFEEVTKVVDNFTHLNDNIQTSFTGAIYSFVPEKSVLGGVLVWRQGKFKKTFQNLQPHYKVSIRMNITYGDENNGWFKYELDSYQSNQIDNPKTGNINLVGDNQKETTVFVEYQYSHNQNQLDIVLSADTEKSSLEDAFIYVSEYFVIVHYCVPFCTSCTGPTISDCSIYTGYNQTHYCSSNMYLKFDSDTQIHTCAECDQLGCLECQSELVCSRCEFSDRIQFLLDQGQCICYPSQYLSNDQCIKCNQYCESCFGQNYDQCYSCNSDFHRAIKEFKCQCLDGFYDDGYNLECIPICGDQKIVDGEDCDDGNSNPFDGCDLCRYQCQDACLNCLNGKCYQCKHGYTYHQTTYQCLTTCGDQIIQGNEQCDDANNDVQDGCYLCNLQCDVHCINCQNGHCFKCDELNGWYFDGSNNCHNICGDGIITKDQEQCDDNNQNPFDLCNNCLLGCSDHCIICENGLCLQCEVGFKFLHQTQQCLPICGDSIIVGYEQCEDEYSQIINSCHQCKLKCNSKCLICEYHICLQCEFGYLLRNNMCEQHCGDGIKVGDEECENKQISQQLVSLGCLNCKQDCGSGCIICTKGICELCKSGYIRLQYECKPICGDMIIVDPEVCEDANMEPYDGCHLCQYSCVPQCLICQLGVCLEMQQPNIVDINPNETVFACSDYCLQCQNQNICIQCDQYFQLSNSYCVPICGDGFIITGLEQCEDGNDIQFDGCYQCQFQCSYGCIECEQLNKCIKCEDHLFRLDIQTNQCVINANQNDIDVLQSTITSNYQLNQAKCDQNYILINNICINQCGNGQLNPDFEECDDNNYQGGDGCSQNCIIEDSYQCLNTEGQLSFCILISSPQIILNLLSEKKNSTQIVEVTFSQQVKLKNDLLFEDLALFSITPLTNYGLFIQPINNISTILSYPIYHITIIFMEPVQDPVLDIKIDQQTIQNEFDVNLQKYEMKINLGNPFILSEETQNKLQSVIKMNEAAMYSMTGISSLAIITGNTIIIFGYLYQGFTPTNLRLIKDQ